MGSGFNFKLEAKVLLNKPLKIIQDHGLDVNGRVTASLRNEVDRLSNPYIPFDNGGLRRLKTYPNNHSIKYISPYARYHYYGELMLTKRDSSWAKKGEKKYKAGKRMKYHTSGTGPKWDKLMMQRRKNDVVRDLQNFINRGGK